jgi:uncharacterized protein YkwD
MRKPLFLFSLGILLISCANLLPPQQSSPPSIRRLGDYGFLDEESASQIAAIGPSPTSVLFDLGVEGTLVVTGEVGGAGEQIPVSTQIPSESGVIVSAMTATLTFFPSNTPVNFPTFTQQLGSNPTNTVIPSWTFTQTPPSTSTAVPTNTTPPTNTSAPSAIYTNPPPLPSNTPVPQTCNPTGNTSFENQVLDLINQERANQGLAPLTLNNQLTSAARSHNQDMACNDFFSHNSPTAGSPFDRILAAGYDYSWAAENIAAGYAAPQDTVAGWMNSSGHRANILGSNYIHVGIGYAYWGSSTYGSYWTAVFAGP